MATGILTVSPEEMQAAATELNGYVVQMQSSFNTMKKLMENSAQYWVGDAGNAHRSMYQEQVEQTEQIVARYTEHVRDLNAMAGVYSQAEQTATRQAEELPAITF